MRDWQERAACRHPRVNPTWFFPAGKKGNLAKRAKQVCAVCPVQDACLEHALAGRITPNQFDTGSRDGSPIDGIWGGTTLDERRVILRQRKAAA